MFRSVRLLALVIGISLLVVASAAADGDPASDTLIFRNVFVPFPAPAKDLTAELERQVAAAYKRGYRLKVAVIGKPTDLGAIPSLFNKPQAYSKFLGSELTGYFVGPLLIVMPAGFGIYDGGRSTAAEQRVLAGQSVSGSATDDLTRTAAHVVVRLVAAGALKSKDITPPYAGPLGANGLRGSSLTLKFTVQDDSGKSSVTVRVFFKGRVVATLRRPMGPVRGDRQYAVTWRVPARLRGRNGQMCVSAVDPSGNRSPKSCSPLAVR